MFTEVQSFLIPFDFSETFQALIFSYQTDVLSFRYFQTDLTLLEETTLDMTLQCHGERVMCCNGWTMGQSIGNMETTNVSLINTVLHLVQIHGLVKESMNQ